MNSGFDGLIEVAIGIVAMPVSLWMAILAIALAGHRSWARWPLAFTFWMAGGIAAETLIFGGISDGQLKVVVALAVVTSVAIVVLLVLPSTGEDLRQGRPHQTV